MSANDNKKDMKKEPERQQEEEWITIINPNHIEKQMDEKGRECLIYWTTFSRTVTKDGGNFAGYILYTDNNELYSWDSKWGFHYKRIMTLLRGQKLEVRKNHDCCCCFSAPCGCCALQVRVTDEE